MEKPRVLFAGGGTAGHLNPALAILEIIREHCPDTEFCFAGTPDSIEERLVKKAGYRFEVIRVKGFQRKLSVQNVKKNLKAASYLVTAGHRARQIITDFKPTLVIGTGGYVSGPVVRKAAQMKIPTAIHEQNAFPGVTTKLLAKHADRVMLTVGAAAKYLKPDLQYVVTGLPVRGAFTKADKRAAKQKLGLSPDEFCVLSTGGSLGAGRMNETIVDLIAWYKENNLPVNHIHSYGGMGKNTFVAALKEKGIDPAQDGRLNIREYIDNMADCMAAADLVISRCGANSLTELEAMGKASILIPSPIVAENHQYHNGMVLQNAGAAIVMEQKDLTSEKLIATVKSLLDHPSQLEKMSAATAKLYIADTNQRIYQALKKFL